MKSLQKKRKKNLLKKSCQMSQRKRLQKKTHRVNKELIHELQLVIALF